MKVWTLAATLLVAVSANTAVFAAKALTPKAQLEKAATHVLVGKVKLITFTTNEDAQYATTTYTAQIAINRVEKGAGLKPGDVVEVRYLSRGWRAAVHRRLSTRAIHHGPNRAIPSACIW
jgi:hypothetical protein